MRPQERATGSAVGDEQNLIELLLTRARTPKGPAARIKSSSGWTDVSWAQVLERVKRISAGLRALGVEKGDRVAIFAATSLEWLLCDLALGAAQVVCVPIYASNTPEEARYILVNSGARLVFVDDDVADGKQPGRLSRLRAKLQEAPDCKAVVLFRGQPQGPGESTLEALEAKGAAAPVEDFEAQVKAIPNEALSHFIYTSGTTGDPKGVMLSHGNWMFEAQALSRLEVMKPDDAMMLFLPLAHSFAQAGKASWLGQGFVLIIAESVEKLIANLGETKPTILPAVPRVFEKVFATVQGNAIAAPGLKGALARWAFKLFDEYVEAKEAGRPYDTLGFALARRLVFSKVKQALDARLGGRMRIFVSGGAPLPRKVAYFFELLGLMVLEGYGLTETSAGATLNVPGRVKVGTVGLPFEGSQVRIADDGEVLIRGPHIMKGYYRNEAATAEVIDRDGWFHSGDIGTIDAEGLVRITDRKKDIIVTAGGKNVAPQNLENLLKTFPIISSAMVYGDRRPYLTALICVSEERARALLGEAAATPYAQLLKRPEIRAAVQEALTAVNAQQPPYNTLKKFELVDHDFSQETGELTPTLKVKRKFCTQKYAALLEGMYDEKLL